MTLQFLDSTTISMAEIFLTVLTERLADKGEIWGEKPRLHTTGITFRRRESDKVVIPIVQTFVVLGGLYKNGNYYKVTPLGEMPGKYDYQHKLCFYSLNPSTYRKTCEQRIRDALSEIILHQRDYLPERMSGVTVQQTNVAHEVSLQTSGNNAHSMLVVITPAIEGGGVPDGIRDSAARHLENQRACHPTWFLIPCSRRPSELQLWNITFEPLQSSLLQRAPSLQQTVLFLTWFSEKFGWGEKGLPSATVFNAIVFDMLQATGGAIAREKFTHQVTRLLTSFRAKLQDAHIDDYFVPKRNLLEVLSSESLANVKSEVEDVVDNLLVSSGAVDEYIRSNYPYYIIRGEEDNTIENALEDVFTSFTPALPSSSGDNIIEEDAGPSQENEMYDDKKVIVEEPSDDSDVGSEHELHVMEIPAKRSESRSSDGYFLEDNADDYETIQITQTHVIQQEISQSPLAEKNPSTKELNGPITMDMFPTGSNDLIKFDSPSFLKMQKSSHEISNKSEKSSQDAITKSQLEVINMSEKSSLEVLSMSDKSSLEVIFKSEKHSQDANNKREKSSQEANNNFINNLEMKDEDEFSKYPFLKKSISSNSKYSEFETDYSSMPANSEIASSNGSATMVNGSASKTSSLSMGGKLPSPPLAQLSEEPLPPPTLRDTLEGNGILAPGIRLDGRQSPTTNQPTSSGIMQRVALAAVVGFVVVTLAVAWLMTTSYEGVPLMFSKSEQKREL